MSGDVTSHRILNKKSKYRRNSKTSWLGEKKIVFLVMLILLYIGLIVCLEVGLTEVPFFAYLVGFSLLMIKLQKESLRQRLGLGRVRPRIYSIMFFILILSSVISGFICYFQVDIQLRYAILGSVIFAPIGEELFFRGYMQGNFEKFFKSNKDKQKNKRMTFIVVILTALLFSIAHFKTEGFLDNAPALFLFGLVYGGLMVLTKSITFSISLHMLHNAQVEIQQGSTFVPILIQSSVGLIIMIVLIINYVRLWLMRKEIKKFHKIQHKTN